MPTRQTAMSVGTGQMGDTESDDSTITAAALRRQKYDSQTLYGILQVDARLPQRSNRSRPTIPPPRKDPAGEKIARAARPLQAALGQIAFQVFWK